MSPRPLAGPRLARVLAMVPWILAHPGVTIPELASRFRVSAREVERDLELLPLCGLPPYTADRLIDVWIGDDGGVTIRLAEYFRRPLRLAPAEGVALVAAARALLAIPGSDPAGPLATAVTKLEAVLGAAGRIAIDVGGTDHLSVLHAATAAHERVEIDYYSYARDEMTTRAIDPMRVFHALGAWYVAAYCHRAEAGRLFRVDRVTRVERTGEHFAMPEDGRVPGFDDDPVGQVFHPRRDDTHVVLRVEPSAAWVAESVPTESVRTTPSGALEIELAVSGPAFLDRLLLQLGPAAVVLRPESARVRRSELARRLLERYRMGECVA